MPKVTLPAPVSRFFPASALALLGLSSSVILASENVPHAPFAQWSEVPRPGQVVARAFYMESESYHIWDRNTRYKVDYRLRGEHYGIDITQGYLAFQYGLTDKWAADLAMGYTTVGWRYFSNNSPNGVAQSTTGLMDSSFGVRYQIFKEGADEPAWKPTLTFRAGAVLPGSYDDDIPFAPGVHSAAIEPELLMRKHFGWDGFGLYSDALFRWNKTSANDQYIVSIGFFQEIKGWEINAGYRRLGTLSGGNIAFDPATRFIEYPRAVKENNDAIEAGFNYTTAKRQARFGFYSRTTINGSNSDQKFWVGGYVEMPFMVAHH